VNPKAWIVDTNVVVAGILSTAETSPPARILDGMLTARFPFVLSEALLSEYRSVLLRDKIHARHGLSSREIDVVLIQLATHAIVLSPEAGPPAPDRSDQFLWNLLTMHDDVGLVTGDKRLLGDRLMGARIVTPRACVDLIGL
jgi:predicted nucleic acid-binding protein